MTVSKKTIIAAAGVGGADYIGSAYHVITNNSSNPLGVEIDASTGYVVFAGRDISVSLHHIDLIDENGDYLWSKKFSVGSNTSASLNLGFDDDNVYFFSRFTNSSWETGKLSKSSGAVTQLGQWPYNDYLASAFNRGLHLDGYFYVAGWRPDDYASISYGDLAHTTRNQFVSECGVANIGSSYSYGKGIEYTVTGTDSFYISTANWLGSVGNKGWAAQYSVTNNTTISRTISKFIGAPVSATNRDACLNAISDSSGNLYVSGYISYTGSALSLSTFFMKFNSSGVYQWSREVSNTSFPDSKYRYGRFSSFICSEGNIHFSTALYEDGDRFIFTCDPDGNLISKTKVYFPQANITGNTNFCAMAGDGFTLVGRSSSSPNEINLVRFPLNTDIAYTSSELVIEYDDTATWTATIEANYGISDTGGSTGLVNQSNLSSATSNTVSDRTSPAWASPVDIPY
jgi:hypothetical protein